MPGYDFSRDVWSEIHPALICAIRWAIENRPLSIAPSWPISSKTVSEIGGRLIEDWIVSNLPDAIEATCATSRCRELKVVAVAGRSIGDTTVTFSFQRKAYAIHIDVKAANTGARDATHRFYIENNIAKKRPGESHPNLISIPRAELWYQSPNNESEDLAIFYCSYKAHSEGGHIAFDLSDSLKGNPLFLLRDIAASNLTAGALGRGQLQLTRISSIQFTERTKVEFCEFLSTISKTINTKKRRVYV